VDTIRNHKSNGGKLPYYSWFHFQTILNWNYNDFRGKKQGLEIIERISKISWSMSKYHLESGSEIGVYFKKTWWINFKMMTKLQILILLEISLYLCFFLICANAFYKKRTIQVPRGCWGRWYLSPDYIQI